MLGFIAQKAHLLSPRFPLKVKIIFLAFLLKVINPLINEFKQKVVKQWNLKVKMFLKVAFKYVIAIWCIL